MGYVEDIADGSAKMTLIMAIPRSVSTVLGRGLGNSPDYDAFITEAFLHPGGHETLSDFVRLAKEGKDATPANPANIVAKEMSSYVKLDNFRILAGSCEHVIFLVREPSAQAASWVYKMEGLSDTDIAQLNDPSEVLSGSETTIYGMWEPHANILSDIGNPEKPKVTVIDGDLLRSFPEWGFRQLSQTLGITFSDKMFRDWAPVEGISNTIALTKYPEFMGRATSTDKMHKSTAKTPKLSDFSLLTRGDIEKSLDIYTLMVNHESGIRPDAEMLRSMMNSLVEENRTFVQACPVTCYTYAAALGKEEENQRNAILTDIRSMFPKHHDAFSIVDSKHASLNARIILPKTAAENNRGI